MIVPKNGPSREALLAMLALCCLAGPALAASCPLIRSPDSTFSLSPDVYLNYRVAGEGTRTLVVLHGFGASLDTWNDIAPELTLHYRVFMPDLLGFGLSARPNAFAYTLQDQAEAVASFLEFVQTQSGGNPITLVGHSYGGTIAMAAYSILKDQKRTPIDRLILIDALAFPRQTHFPLYVNILRVPIVNRLVLNTIPQKCRASWVLKRVFFRRALVTPERVCRYAQFYDLPGSHRALIRSAHQLGNRAEARRLVAWIAEIDSPTLIVWGAHDRLIPPPQAALLHQAISTSQEAALLESGHVPQEELPEVTAGLIESFLDR